MAAFERVFPTSMVCNWPAFCRKGSAIGWTLGIDPFATFATDSSGEPKFGSYARWTSTSTRVSRPMPKCKPCAVDHCEGRSADDYYPAGSPSSLLLEAVTEIEDQVSKSTKKMIEHGPRQSDEENLCNGISEDLQSNCVTALPRSQGRQNIDRAE